MDVNSTAHVGVQYGVDDVVLGVVYTVISLLIIASNSIVVIVVATSSELHLPTLWNIAFMAFCDLLYGVYCLVFIVPSKFLNRFAYNPNLMFVTACTGTWLISQGILNCVIAVLDRCFAICYPLKYVRVVTLKRFVIVILITFLLNFSRLCLIIFPETNFYFNEDIALCVFDFNTPKVVVANLSLSVIAFIIIIVCVVTITHAVYTSARFCQSETPHVIKVSVCVSVTAAIFCLAYMPAGVAVVWNLVASKENIPSVLIKVALTAILSNSLFDVVVYASAYKPFREALFRLCCNSYFRRKRQLAVTTIHL